MTLGKQCMNIMRSSRKRIEIDLKTKKSPRVEEYND